MINRRHIRVKVMQSIYAMVHADSSDIIKEEKFLRHSIDKMYDLYVLSLDMLVRVNQLATETIEKTKKKHLATAKDLNPNVKFSKNRVLTLLKDSTALQTYLEEHKLNHWYLNDKMVTHIYNQLMDSELYKNYMDSEDDSFKKDQKFVIKFFTEIVAPDEKLASFFEDEQISWVDDIPFVNTWILRTLQELKPERAFVLNRLYKNQDDKDFVSDLLKKTILNHTEYEKEVQNKTPNWETERIADMDMILIKMAICEFLKFSSIPVKATINEYLELAKDYSTEKSSFFINGVLDKLWREFQDTGRLNKIGRGNL